MRHSVTIERRTAQRDTAGGQLDVWELFAERRAERVVQGGREAQAQQQEAGRVSTLFRVRFIDGVLTSMRLICAGRLYDIKAALPDSQNSELTLVCEEQVGEVVS